MAEYGWKIYACPDCGLDGGPEPVFVYRQCDECGSHKPRQVVEVVPRVQADKLAEALRETREALRKHTSTWIALSNLLQEPYPDDSRWTPWTRFAARACNRGEKALKAARAALDVYETEGR